MRKGASFAVAATGAALLSAALLGCSGNDGQSQAPLARVDVVTANVVDFAPRVTLTGTIQAQVQNDLSFRLSGKIIERNVDIGDHVTADQVLARLDPRTQEADLESAKAGVQSAEAQLKQAIATYQRQKALIDSGFTTRTSFDQAEQSLRTAQALAEVGQVVEQARAIFAIAKDGPRDAVFDVYEAIFAQVPDDAKAEITLVSDPKVAAEGTVREIAPAVDTNTGTVRVKVGIPQTP